MNDDDLRRALHGPTEPISSYRVLQDLRPSMRRARHRRRAAVGAAAAVLLVGGGAGVLALASAPGSQTVSTISSDDENGAIVSTLPPVSELSDIVDTEELGAHAAPTTAAATTPVEQPAPAPPAEDQPEDPQAPETTSKPGSPGVAPPPDQLPPSTATAPATTAAPTPVAPAAPPQATGPTSQVLTSACGDVVVEFDQRAVGITSIASLPGYTSQVGTDGPESVEVKFLGADGTCEVHAELGQNGLDVEIQTSDHDD